jgi:GntR family transcriptional regulator
MNETISPAEEGIHYRLVSRTSPLPLYHQVELDMRERIQSGEWRGGEQIPAEAELCALYGASRVTIREAIGRLAADGLLVRRRGRGTFVCEARITAGVRGLTSFTEEMAKLGLQGGSRVLHIAIEPCPAVAARRLRLAEGADAVTLKRLRLGDGAPVGIQTAYLPAGRLPGLERLDLSGRSLYATLADRYAIAPVEAEETFEVAPIRGEDAQLLEVRSGSCGFRVERVTFDMRGAFEFAISIMRGDRYRIRIGLRASP